MPRNQERKPLLTVSTSNSCFQLLNQAGGCQKTPWTHIMHVGFWSLLLCLVIFRFFTAFKVTGDKDVFHNCQHMVGDCAKFFLWNNKVDSKWSWSGKINYIFGKKQLSKYAFKIISYSISHFYIPSILLKYRGIGIGASASLDPTIPC